MFEKVGGYLDSIEEDRELRNRVIATGHIAYFLDQPLVDKIEMADSLTVAHQTNYEAEHRRRDRDAVWQRQRLYRELLLSEDKDAVDWSEIIVPADLRGVNLEVVSRPEMLTTQPTVPFLGDVPCLPRPRSNGQPSKLVVA